MPPSFSYTNLDPRAQALRVQAAAEAAGLRTYLFHSRDAHTVECGRAWVAFGTAQSVGREESLTTPRKAGVPCPAGEDVMSWALRVLGTGRSVEVGPGIGLRVRQDAVYVAYETVDYPLDALSEVVRSMESPWNLDPDYQRGHVWTEEQQRLFVGNFLVVQRTPLLFLNYGRRGGDRQCEVVDGKQRLTALLGFLDGKIPATLADGDVWWRQFDEVDRRCAPNVPCARVYLPTRAAVLQFYLNLNSAGTVHKPEEIARVRALLQQALPVQGGAS